MDYDEKTRDLPRKWINNATFNNVIIEKPKKVNGILQEINK
jgi:hypothetical protein